MGNTAKVTSKGQVILRAVSKVAGKLKGYAHPERIPEEKEAWKKAVSDRALT